jgi:hypothetical protein
MCIYLLDKQDLHYDSADHIIPAGLGGIKKLPLEYVSREFNILSSKFEKSLMRTSIISMPRQILGPGKRGSLNPNKATKSSISVFRQHPDNDSFSLGYIQVGKPFEIPHIVLNSETGAFTVGLNKESTEIELEVFKQQLTEFDNLRIKMIKFQDLDTNTFLIGIKSNIEDNFDCFIASKDGETHPFNNKALEEIAEMINDKSTFSGSIKYKVKTHQNAFIGDDYYKCCAKIGFNCLAHLKGQDFVLRNDFNTLRNWIVNGGENNFVSISPNHDNVIQKMFPEDSHQVIITKIENTLIADICFYNHFHNLIRLADNFFEPFHLDGFICDWKGKKEFSYFEYMTTFVKANQGAY